MTSFIETMLKGILNKISSIIAILFGIIPFALFIAFKRLSKKGRF